MKPGIDAPYGSPAAICARTSAHRFGGVSSVVILAILGMVACSRHGPESPEQEPEPAVAAASDASQATGTADEKDIFRIYDEMVAAKAVARECGVSTAELDEKHDRNFRSVTHAVREELTKRHGKPEADLDAFLGGHDEMTRSRTLGMLASHPCDSPDAKVVIERYRRQSLWQMPAGN
mgnify:CR=1 FL=1